MEINIKAGLSRYSQKSGELSISRMDGIKSNRFINMDEKQGRGGFGGR